jgi:hypothetical protein
MESETSALDKWRWTLGEYVLRCEDGDDIREILVEGAIDQDVIDDALKRWNADGVNVLGTEYLDISDDEIRAAGFSHGAKGELLTVAAALESARRDSDLSSEITVVIDRDYDELASETLGSIVLLTDGHSLESYAFSPAVLDRFVAMALGRHRQRAGTANPSAERRTCTGQELYERLRQAVTEIAAVRLVLRSLPNPPPVFNRWLDYVRVDKDGVASTDAERLLRRVLDQAHRSDTYSSASAKLSTEIARVESDEFRLVRGHDFVQLLMKLLRSSWGRPIISGLGQATESVFARLLLLAVESGQLDSYPLFEELRRRFAAPESILLVSGDW